MKPIEPTIKIAIGLVGKCDDQFMKEWLESADKCGDVILVVDNGIQENFRKKIIANPKTKQYLIQDKPNRNMSRDYQKILDMAKEEKCHWIWIMDHDKFVPNMHKEKLKSFLCNSKDATIGFPLFEMRGDKNHYVKIRDMDGSMKDARLCHEMFKVQSHFAYDIDDEHSGVIPQNALPGDSFLPIPIHHYGHLTPELREEKRQKYIKDKEDFGYDDKGELAAEWMKEDDNDVIIKDFREFINSMPDFTIYDDE